MKTQVAVFRPLVLNNVKEARLAMDTGPFRVGVVVHRNTLVLLWRIGRQRYWQTLKRVRFKSSTWVLCPTCGGKTWRLFALPGGYFTCQKCAGLRKGYDLWHRNGRDRQPKTPRAWLKWYVRRAGKALKGGKSGETQARPTGGCPGGTPCGR